MSRVKYFINIREPGATGLAEQMRKVGIDFSSLATFGPLVLWIDGRAYYGVNAVKHAVHKLVESAKAGGILATLETKPTGEQHEGNMPATGATP